MKVKCGFKFIVLKLYNFHKTVVRSLDFAAMRIVCSKFMQNGPTGTKCRSGYVNSQVECL
jgi:hypothetical protein